MSTSYKDAGVDVEKNQLLKEDIKRAVRSTFNSKVIGDVGLFGGLFDISSIQKYTHPVLVASTDGVGTKMKIAKAVNSFDTVGIDLVNHCINDILVQGAKPLFFMDYIAGEKLDPQITAPLIRGLAKGCSDSGLVLLGGETAEMPGVYEKGEYDLAGTIIGVIEKSDVINGKTIKEGDVLLGLPSSGLHTNGYSLARKVLLEKEGMQLSEEIPELRTTLGKALLEPHRSYLNDILPLIERFEIKGMAHITGGGFSENIPRIIPKGLGVQIQTSSWKVPAIFELIRNKGNIEQNEMYRTFNMGIGLVIVASNSESQKLKAQLKGSVAIGKVVKGSGVVYV